MSKTRYQALGRLKKGERNKTEARYEQYLEIMKKAGQIKWYKFEGLKLRLADKTFLTPDFVVLTNEDLIELHDVKGSKRIFTDDARVKMKVVADMYPFIVKAIYPNKSGWEEELF